MPVACGKDGLVGAPFAELAAELCAGCGECCRRHPGIAAPEDFGCYRDEIVANVREALIEGSWRIDWWEGTAILPRTRKEVEQPYFIRPAVKQDPKYTEIGLISEKGRIFSGSWGGECVFLGEHGCRLPTDGGHVRRPYECRWLEPKPDLRCTGIPQSKLAIAELWIEAHICLESIGYEVAQLVHD